MPKRPAPRSAPRSKALTLASPRKPASAPASPYHGPPLHFVVTGIPRSGKNSQRQVINKRTGGRFTIKSKAAAEWLESAVTQLLQQRPPRIHGACLVSLDIYHALPLTSWDKDNVTSLVYDALKHAGVLVDDKAAIARQGAQMTYVDKGAPRVEITVSRCTRSLTSNAEQAA